MGGLNDFMFGKKEKNKKQTLLTDQQSGALNDYFENPIEKNATYGAGNDYLQRLLSNDPEAYAAFEKPYMENFEQNIAPGIAERYAGLGTGGGALSSSAFSGSLAQAGRNLQSDLAMQRGQMQMAALPQALQYAQQPYTNKMAGIDQRTFENVNRPETHGLIGEATKSFVNAGAKQAGKNMFGGVV